ncbi:hypothetical protein [Kribbella sp. NPDC048915]|uniref:hypothetical protein n=1 Tax=Kribbella sp. NPDC048915 TaxID=3155148 RepID=UPI0033E544DB
MRTSVTSSRRPASGSPAGEKYLQFNREYPGDWTATLTRLTVDGTSAVGSLNFTVGEQRLVALVSLELHDRLVTNITDFWPEPYAPPPAANTWPNYTRRP